MTPTQPSRTAGSASDFASSLREAALLTLKTKRRKATVAPLPAAALSRPAPPASSLQLDYGNDEPSSPLATSETTISSKSSASQAPPAQIEPGPAREEGEISDNEDSPVEPKPSLPYPSKGKRPARQQVAASRGQRAPSQPTSKPGQEKGTTKLTLQARITPQVSVLVSNPTPYVLDAEHVRPNLACPCTNTLVLGLTCTHHT
jgi:hypothetical protein